MSLEKHVTEQTPPCFLWHTATDELVPVENSYMYADECKKQGERHAYHVFSRGPHGLSLSNKDWEAGNIGEPNTMEQLVNLEQAIKDGTLTVPDDYKKFVLSLSDTDLSEKRREQSLEAVEEVAVWPLLADQWLKSIGLK